MKAEFEVKEVLAMAKMLIARCVYWDDLNERWSCLYCHGYRDKQSKIITHSDNCEVETAKQIIDRFKGKTFCGFDVVEDSSLKPGEIKFVPKVRD